MNFSVRAFMAVNCSAGDMGLIFPKPALGEVKKHQSVG
jgi:hypothetical protein